MKNTNIEEESHLLGNDIFTKAITTEDSHATFRLPEDGEWIDFWTGECHQGWSTDDGQKRSKVEVIVDEVELMSQKAEAKPEPEPAYSDFDLPF